MIELEDGEVSALRSMTSETFRSSKMAWGASARNREIGDRRTILFMASEARRERRRIRGVRASHHIAPGQCRIGVAVHAILASEVGRRGPAPLMARHTRGARFPTGLVRELESH